MLEKIDYKWTRGGLPEKTGQMKWFLFFEDKGYVSKGSKTRLFHVTSVQSGALLGYVKWLAQWRQYTAHIVGSIFDRKCLTVMAEFLETKTAEHKGK